MKDEQITHPKTDAERFYKIIVILAVLQKWNTDNCSVLAPSPSSFFAAIT